MLRFAPKAFYAGHPLTWLLICVVLGWLCGLGLAIGAIAKLQCKLGFPLRAGTITWGAMMLTAPSSFLLAVALAAAFVNFSWWAATSTTLAALFAVTRAADGRRWARVDAGQLKADGHLDFDLFYQRQMKVYGALLSAGVLVAIYFLEPGL
ncbi:MAG TPA: hypothetical protein VGH86_00885 [Phenylobacterium sp.]